MKKNLFIFIFIFILSLISFFNLWNTYFQQDEWYWFGQSIYANQYGILNLFKVAGFHFIPLTGLLTAALYQLFKLQFSYYIVFSLILHALNSFLVYILGAHLADKKTAFLASILFLVANTSQQATTWVGASIALLPATFFALISFILFLKYFEMSKKRYLIWSVLFLIISLGFKEDAVFLFFFYLLYGFFFQKRHFWKVLTFDAIFGIVYIAGRYVIEIISPQAILLRQQTSFSGIISLVTHTILFPLQAFSKLYFSPELMYPFSHFLMDRHAKEISLIVDVKSFGNFALFVEDVGMKFVSVTLTTLLILTGSILLKKIGRINNNLKTKIKIAFIFIVLSILPYGFLPKNLVMESRHFYIPMIGASLLLSMIFYSVFYGLKGRFSKIAFMTVIIGYLGLNIYLNQRNIRYLMNTSRSRIIFVTQIQPLFTVLPQKTIFLSSGDPLSFQSGVGQMLMVLFRNQQPYFQLLRSNFLWDLGSQGYKEMGDKGFGYFNDFNLLKETYVNYGIKPSSVFSFYWDSNKQKLIDTTEQTRNKLVSDNTVIKR